MRLVCDGGEHTKWSNLLFFIKNSEVKYGEHSHSQCAEVFIGHVMALCFAWTFWVKDVLALGQVTTDIARTGASVWKKLPSTRKNTFVKTLPFAPAECLVALQPWERPSAMAYSMDLEHTIAFARTEFAEQHDSHGLRLTLLFGFFSVSNVCSGFPQNPEISTVHLLPRKAIATTLWSRNARSIIDSEKLIPRAPLRHSEPVLWSAAWLLQRTAEDFIEKWTMFSVRLLAFASFAGLSCFAVALGSSLGYCICCCPQCYNFVRSFQVQVSVSKTLSDIAIYLAKLEVFLSQGCFRGVL